MHTVAHEVRAASVDHVGDAGVHADGRQAAVGYVEIGDGDARRADGADIGAARD